MQTITFQLKRIIAAGLAVIILQEMVLSPFAYAHTASNYKLRKASIFLNPAVVQGKVKQMADASEKIVDIAEYRQEVRRAVGSEFTGRSRTANILRQTSALVPDRRQVIDTLHHLSALHAGTLVELVTMICENHRDNDLLNQLMPKSFNELFREIVIARSRGGDSEGVKYEWNERDIERYGSGFERVLTEFLRLYLRDYINTPAFNITENKWNPAQKMVMPEVNREVEHQINNTYQFLGIEMIKTRIYNDRYLKKNQNLFLLAFYTDDGWWTTSGRPMYAFQSEGELALGDSLVAELAKLPVLERGERIKALVSRELMARALALYNTVLTDTPEFILDSPYDLKFDGIHKIIDTYPDSKSILERVFAGFPGYQPKESPKRYAALVKVFKNVAEYGGRLSFSTARAVIKNFTEQTKLLELARNIATPVFVVGVVAAIVAAGPSFAFDGASITQSVANWKPLLLMGGTIGTTLISFTMDRSKGLQDKQPNPTEEVKSDFYKIAGPLNETNVVHELFSFFHNVMSLVDQSGIRLIMNIKHLKSDPKTLKELKSFAVDSAKDKNRDYRYQIVIATDESVEGMTKRDVRDFLIEKEIPQDFVDKHILILHQPLDGEVFNLQAFVETYKKKLLSSGYSIHVINNQYWLIVKEIMKSPVWVNGLELFELNLIGKDTVEEAA